MRVSINKSLQRPEWFASVYYIKDQISLNKQKILWFIGCDTTSMQASAKAMLAENESISRYQVEGLKEFKGSKKYDLLSEEVKQIIETVSQQPVPNHYLTTTPWL